MFQQTLEGAAACREAALLLALTARDSSPCVPRVPEYCCMVVMTISHVIV
jgi:hypothetical protein